MFWLGDRRKRKGESAGRRRKVVLGVAAAAVLLSAGGLVGATFVKSPTQLAAEQQAPPPTLLTATVVEQVVGDTLVLRGTVTAAQEFQVTPAPSGANTAAPVVTGVRKSTGDEVRAGEVIAEVSGRPLVALHGDTPAFRDLRPGSHGADVRMLQQALAELGFSSGGDEAGQFGAGTRKAVRGYYEKLGFDVPTTGGSSGEDASALQSASDAVTQAERHLRDLREAAAGGHQIDDAAEDLRAARARLADLDAHSGPMVPRSEVVFLPSFPARIGKFTGKLGADVQAPLVTVSAGSLQVTGRLDPADRSLVRQGVPAEIDSEAAGWHGTGKVTGIAEQEPQAPAPTGQPGPGQSPPDTSHLPVTVVPDSPPPPTLIGQDVRLTLRFAQTSGPVLAVPQAAITSAADGRTYVTKVGVEGVRSRVEVRAGVSGNGLVEISPVSGGVAAGDKVVIGS